MVLMEGKYKPGQYVYLSAANKGLVREAMVLKYSGGFYTIRFTGGGGTRVRENRLFLTLEEALAGFSQKKQQ